MLKRLALAALLASLPTVAPAQGVAPAATAVCDGSQIRRIERTREVGRALFFAAAAADLTAVLTIPRTPEGARAARGHFGVVAVTAPIAIAGFVLANNARPAEKFWEGAIARLKVGETRSADVRLCLHRPDVSSSNGAEERWTYLISRPAALGGGTVHLLGLYQEPV